MWVFSTEPHVKEGYALTGSGKHDQVLAGNEPCVSPRGNGSALSTSVSRDCIEQVAVNDKSRLQQICLTVCDWEER